MIFEKTYNFNDVSKEYIGYLTLRDYHKTILTDIIQQCHPFTLKGYIDHVIVVGAEGFSMLLDQSNFFVSSMHSKFYNDHFEKVGMLLDKNVYYDLTLKSNKVIIGSDLNLIE
jgi:hypothetical protein